MRKRERYERYEEKSIPVWIIILIILALLAVLAYGLATIWQNIQDTVSPPVTSVNIESLSHKTIEKITNTNLATQHEQLLDVEIFQPTYPPRPQFPDAVPETTEPKGYDYFDNAIFFGDSISTGIPIYLEQVLPDIAVIAKTGVSPHSAAINEIIEIDGTAMTMLDAAKAQYGERQKVYIMLGSNNLDFDKKSFIEGYKEFINAVKKAYPNAVIYLQSMTPVTGTPAQQAEYPSLNNAKIDEYNRAIMELAKQENVYYLDVAVAFLNEDGILPTEASPDGVHFIGEYYYKWFDYLKKHTVER